MHYAWPLVQFYHRIKDLSPLAFRLALAYGFYGPAMMKWSNIAATQQSFASLGIPLADYSAYLVATVEALGVPLLLLGLGTRTISSLLFIVMLVALFGVCLPHGFDATLPACFSLALFSLMTGGAGRYSVDYHYCECENRLRK